MPKYEPWTTEVNDIYNRAISAYGKNEQCQKAMEECAELIVALQHYRHGRASIEDVRTEIADVSIMIDQLKIIFDPKAVDREEARKLNRLELRLNVVGDM